MPRKAMPPAEWFELVNVILIRCHKPGGANATFFRNDRLAIANPFISNDSIIVDYVPAPIISNNFARWKYHFQSLLRFNTFSRIFKRFFKGFKRRAVLHSIWNCVICIFTSTTWLKVSILFSTNAWYCRFAARPLSSNNLNANSVSCQILIAEFITEFGKNQFVGSYRIFPGGDLVTLFGAHRKNCCVRKYMLTQQIVSGIFSEKKAGSKGDNNDQ